MNKKNLIRGIPISEKVIELSCGKAHTILRTSSKKVYTFGYGREGQLGHSNYSSEE
jgi:alpha-tubulin suppressor-like RCC1 family protein